MQRRSLKAIETLMWMQQNESSICASHTKRATMPELEALTFNDWKVALNGIMGEQEANQHRNNQAS